MNMSSGGLIGVLIGGGLLILGVIICCVVVYRNRREYGKPSANDTEMEMNAVAPNQNMLDHLDGDAEDGAIDTKQSIVADEDDDDDDGDNQQTL